MAIFWIYILKSWGARHLTFLEIGRKRDLKQVDAITRKFNFSGELRNAFGDFLVEEKRCGYGGMLNSRGDFTDQELWQKAQEFLVGTNLRINKSVRTLNIIIFITW